MGCAASTKIKTKTEIACYHIENAFINMYHDKLPWRPDNITRCQHICRQMYDHYGILDIDLAIISNISEDAISFWRQCDNPYNSDIGAKILKSLWVVYIQAQIFVQAYIQNYIQNYIDNKVDDDGADNDYDSELSDSFINDDNENVIGDSYTTVIDDNNDNELSFNSISGNAISTFDDEN